MEDTFLTQLLKAPKRVQLDLFVNREGLLGDVMVRGLLGHSHHEVIEFAILGEVRSGISRAWPSGGQTLAFSGV